MTIWYKNAIGASNFARVLIEKGIPYDFRIDDNVYLFTLRLTHMESVRPYVLAYGGSWKIGSKR